MKREIKKNWFEWLVFAVSVVVVGAVVGYLVYATAAGDDRPPDIRVTLGPARAQSEYFVVPVTVRNAGGRSAEDVRVEVSLHARDTTVEETTLTFRFLPWKAERQAHAVFSTDPRGAGRRLRARLLSYAAP